MSPPPSVRKRGKVRRRFTRRTRRRGFSKFRKFRRGNTSSGLTGWSSQRTVYSFRKAPKWKRRGAKRFRNKVINTIRNNIGTISQTILNNAARYVSGTLGATTNAPTKNSQAIGTVMQIGTYADINNMWSTLKTNFGGIISSSSDNSAKFTWCGYDVESTIVNQTNATVIFEWYDVIPRYDSTRGPIEIMAIGSNNITSGGITQMGFQPYNFTTMTTAMKILKKGRIILAQGASHLMSRRKKFNKKIVMDRILQMTPTSTSMYRGYSFYRLFFAWAQPAQDNTTNTIVQHGICEILITNQEKNYFFAMPQNSNLLNYIETTSNVTTAKIMPIVSTATVTQAIVG